MQKKGYVLSKRKLLSLDARLIQIQTIDELPKKGCVFVVFDFDDDITCDAVIALRQNAIYRYCPFFSWDVVPDVCQPLLDGAFEETAYKKAEEIQARILSCERNDGKHPERQDSSVFICRYLFVRDGMQLLPELTYHNQYGFSLFECFCFKPERRFSTAFLSISIRASLAYDPICGVKMTLVSFVNGP